MTTTIRINDETEHAINELGGTFDSPNDVIQRLIREAGYDNLLEQTNTAPVESKPEDVDTYTIILQSGNKDTVRFNEQGYGAQASIMADVANHLIQEHDLIEEITPLPYVPRGEKPLINDSPIRPDGEQMRGFEELNDGLYIDTNYPAPSKMERLKDLAEECGLSIEFEGDW